MKRIVLIILLIIMLHVVVADSEVVEYDGHYYQIKTLSTYNYDWQYTKQQCEDINADLVVISSEKEVKFISSLTKSFLDNVEAGTIYEARRWLTVGVSMQGGNIVTVTGEQFNLNIYPDLVIPKDNSKNYYGVISTERNEFFLIVAPKPVGYICEWGSESSLPDDLNNYIVEINESSEDDFSFIDGGIKKDGLFRCFEEIDLCVCTDVNDKLCKNHEVGELFIATNDGQRWTYICNETCHATKKEYVSGCVDDSDCDGINDLKDYCPDSNGIVDNYGCSCDQKTCPFLDTTCRDLVTRTINENDLDEIDLNVICCDDKPNYCLVDCSLKIKGEDSYYLTPVCDKGESSLSVEVHSIDGSIGNSDLIWYHYGEVDKMIVGESLQVYIKNPPCTSASSISAKLYDDNGYVEDVNGFNIIPKSHVIFAEVDLQHTDTSKEYTEYYYKYYCNGQQIGDDSKKIKIYPRDSDEKWVKCYLQDSCRFNEATQHCIKDDDDCDWMMGTRERKTLDQWDVTFVRYMEKQKDIDKNQFYYKIRAGTEFISSGSDLNVMIDYLQYHGFPLSQFRDRFDHPIPKNGVDFIYSYMTSLDDIFGDPEYGCLCNNPMCKEDEEICLGTSKYTCEDERWANGDYSYFPQTIDGVEYPACIMKDGKAYSTKYYYNAKNAFLPMCQSVDLSEYKKEGNVYVKEQYDSCSNLYGEGYIGQLKRQREYDGCSESGWSIVGGSCSCDEENGYMTSYSPFGVKTSDEVMGIMCYQKDILACDDPNDIIMDNLPWGLDCVSRPKCPDGCQDSEICITDKNTNTNKCIIGCYNKDDCNSREMCVRTSKGYPYYGECKKTGNQIERIGLDEQIDKIKYFGSNSEVRFCGLYNGEMAYNEAYCAGDWLIEPLIWKLDCSTGWVSSKSTVVGSSNCKDYNLLPTERKIGIDNSESLNGRTFNGFNNDVEFCFLTQSNQQPWHGRAICRGEWTLNPEGGDSTCDIDGDSIKEDWEFYTSEYYLDSSCGDNFGIIVTVEEPTYKGIGYSEGKHTNDVLFDKDYTGRNNIVEFCFLKQNNGKKEPWHGKALCKGNWEINPVEGTASCDTDNDPTTKDWEPYTGEYYYYGTCIENFLDRSDPVEEEATIRRIGVGNNNDDILNGKIFSGYNNEIQYCGLYKGVPREGNAVCRGYWTLDPDNWDSTCDVDGDSDKNDWEEGHTSWVEKDCMDNFEPQKKKVGSRSSNGKFNTVTLCGWNDKGQDQETTVICYGSWWVDPCNWDSGCKDINGKTVGWSNAKGTTGACEPDCSYDNVKIMPSQSNKKTEGHSSTIEFCGIYNDKLVYRKVQCKGDWWVNPCDWASGCNKAGGSEFKVLEKEDGCPLDPDMILEDFAGVCK